MFIRPHKDDRSQSADENARRLLTHKHPGKSPNMRQILHLQTLPLAQRVSLRLSTWRDVYSTQQLTELVRDSKNEWKSLLGLSNTSKVKVRVSCYKSKMMHTKGIETAVKRGLNVTYDDDGVEEKGEEDYLFILNNKRNKVTLSIDTSGKPLYDRGYRVAGDAGKSPLRPTVASYMVDKMLERGRRRVGEEKEVNVLVDPFCGSGTICIEAGLLLRPMMLRKR